MMDRFDVAAILIIVMASGLAVATWWLWRNGRVRSDRRDRARDDARWRERSERLDDKPRQQD
jgi:hypothetical protein